MRMTALLFLLASSLLFSDEYDFDMEAIESIEPKSYEYNGYLRADDRFQRLNTESPLYIQSGDDRSYQNYIYFEGQHTITSMKLCLKMITRSMNSMWMLK
jgi:hypothetical protein